jgi:bifunctional non-homologous end joining protein LigD
VSDLTDYRSKRDFTQTPEPAGDSRAEPEGGRFVIQEHHARRLHWDLRLERDGVLASWALPRGLPTDPRRNHLAVRTEDHPLEYLDFEGDIPAGSYGAGTMKIWDRGTYTVRSWEPDKVVVTLEGRRAHGQFALFRTRGDDWMIHRMGAPEDPTREPLPDHVEAMLPTEGRLPRVLESWALEPMWTGLRALVYTSEGRARVETTTGDDLLARFPELRAAGAAFGAVEAVLDGEVVLTIDGRTDTDALAARLEEQSVSRIRRLSHEHPAVLAIADVPWFEGHSIAQMPFSERRAVLDSIDLSENAVQIVRPLQGDAASVRAVARETGLFGISARRLDARYEHGRKSRGWRLETVSA